jgi:eukaryotic-like serine/threonine-protein kinase
MTPERWEEIKRLFEAASELPAEERSGYLDAACAADAALRAEVKNLLLADAEAGSFIEAPAYEAATKPMGAGEPAGRDGAPQRIGAYRLLSELGRGGMGAVYLAERADDEYRRRVAIKLIRRGMDSDEILRRFRHERQILASLDHPHIARLLDGGTSADGLPYFVMEHIEGEPLTDYCDRRRLSVTARLQLFRDVCAAVHYAHQSLVVHRDLKPSNILVTNDGAVKLLDFGIAKLLFASELTPLSLRQTAPGVRLMTPEYASPEQVRGETVTTASDIYALGVILYELLTGRRPYRLTRRSLHEVERIVCEQEPERPSTAISRVEAEVDGAGELHALATPESVSLTREGSPERLRRRLRGDLDNIVLRALSKEPARRYGSAEQFSEDLRRHLTGLPVIARPDTFGYRSGKFIRRHKAGVAAAAAAALMLAGFGANQTAQSARLARERDRAVAAERVAAEQRREAERSRDAERAQREMAEANLRRAGERRSDAGQHGGSAGENSSRHHRAGFGVHGRAV